jgi:hypothetical protein
MSLEKFKLFYNATVGEDDEVKSFMFASDGTALTHTTGALNVNISGGSITVTEQDVYAEDSAAANGALGTFILAVRQDSLTGSTSTDGDYGAFKANSKGELYVKDTDVLAQLIAGVAVTATNLDIRDLTFAADKVDVTGSSVTVTAANLDIRDLVAATDAVSAWTKDGAGNSIGSLGGNLLVADCVTIGAVETSAYVAATAVTITAASNQEKVEIQNLSNSDIYYGPVGTTTVANGLLIPKKSIKEIDLAGAFDLISADVIASGLVRVGKFIAA